MSLLTRDFRTILRESRQTFADNPNRRKSQRQSRAYEDRHETRDTTSTRQLIGQHGWNIA